MLLKGMRRMRNGRRYDFRCGTLTQHAFERTRNGEALGFRSDTVRETPTDKITYVFHSTDSRSENIGVCRRR